MKKLKFLLSVVAMSFIMVGCGSSGGSGSSTPAIDNSVYLENQYGYFGEGVVFGNRLVVGVMWEFFNRDDNFAFAIYGRFEADGDGYLDSPNNPNRKYIDYGVSQDGRIIKIGGEYTATITLKSILYDYHKIVQSDGSSATYDCYDIIFDDVYGSHNVVMCPNP